MESQNTVSTTLFVSWVFNISVVRFPSSETTLVAELHTAGLCFSMKPFAGTGNLEKDIMCRDFRLYRTPLTYSKGGLERTGRVGSANVLLAAGFTITAVIVFINWLEKNCRLNDKF